MHSITEKLRDDLTAAVANDELILPTMPEVALRVKQVAEDDMATPASIAKVIGNDVGMTARIIRVANSPLLRGVQTVDDLQMAITRMGMAYACNLAIGIAMEQLFQARTKVVDKMMRDCWAHSTEVAAISHVLCQHFTRLRPDRATLAGFVHEIGVLPILTYADVPDEWSEQALKEAIDELHPELGSKILQAWDFPVDLLNVPFQYLEFARDNQSIDYADVVLVANLQARAGTSHPLTRVDCSKVTAFDHLGLDPNVIWSEQKGVAEDLAAARELLH